MKSTEGRRRVVIEEIQPQVNGGRYPAKRVLGDKVTVTAAIFSDGHDHVAARLLYRHHAEKKWQVVPFLALPNDLWSATFSVDQLGTWLFTVEGWVDHLDTWIHDLGKRLDAQPDPHQPTQTVEPQDIPLQLQIGASLLGEAAGRAKGQDAAAKALLYQSLARVQLKVPEASSIYAALAALSLALQPCKIDGIRHVSIDDMQGNRLQL